MILLLYFLEEIMPKYQNWILKISLKFWKLFFRSYCVNVFLHYFCGIKANLNIHKKLLKDDMQIKRLGKYDDPDVIRFK